MVEREWRGGIFATQGILFLPIVDLLSRNPSAPDLLESGPPKVNSVRADSAEESQRNKLHQERVEEQRRLTYDGWFRDRWQSPSTTIHIGMTDPKQ